MSRPDPAFNFQVHLFQGCCHEAARADIVALHLRDLRDALPNPAAHHAAVTALAFEVRTAARLLRDLADRSQVHLSRVPVVLDHLNLLLPCLQRTLEDMMRYYEDRSVSREVRWRRMYHRMMDEVGGGTTLQERFRVYGDFARLLLGLLLTRSLGINPNALEALRERILQFRAARGIPLPAVQAGLAVGPSPAQMPAGPIDQGSTPPHWSERIFTRPLPSGTTALEGVKESTSYGPHKPWGFDFGIPRRTKILLRRTFDGDRLALLIYLNLIDRVPYLLIRTLYSGGPWFALRGAHELVIRREGAALYLRRWSTTESRAKPWASLYFQTWEQLVLFHCTFVVLKRRDDILTMLMNPDEYKLAGEERLFQAQIRDDGFTHCLIVYQDDETKGIRLHAAVWEGQVRRCPVWTAFVTHQCASPTWLERRSRHRVWLRDLQLHVFCPRYREQYQRPVAAAGAFEVRFATVEAADQFSHLFQPRAVVPPEATTQGTEAAAAAGRGSAGATTGN